MTLTTANPLTLDAPGYFETLAAFEDSHWWSRNLWAIAEAWLVEALRGARALRTLDVGAGAGGMLDRLATRPEVGRVVGIEPSPEALRVAQLRDGSDHPLLRASALRLPIADASIDLLTCLDVFQHLPDRSEPIALEEFARVLRPGGLALIRTNGRGLGRSGVQAYRLEHLRGLASDAGFRVRRASYVNALPSLAIELCGRIGSGRPSHPEGGGLRVSQPSRPRQILMRGLGLWEMVAIGRLGLPCPFGHSAMLLLGKPKPLGG